MSCRLPDRQHLKKTDSLPPRPREAKALRPSERPPQLAASTVMAVLSPHVYCRGQSGKNLLAMSISHFDPNEKSDLVFKAMPDGLHHSSIN